MGAEALVRWRRADGALIPPLKFIPLFERNGNIIRLDEYVFRAVCRQQKEWQKQGQKMLPVSVNISRVSLYYSSVVEKFQTPGKDLVFPDVPVSLLSFLLHVPVFV